MPSVAQIAEISCEDLGENVDDSKPWNPVAKKNVEPYVITEKNWFASILDEIKPLFFTQTMLVHPEQYN